MTEPRASKKFILAASVPTIESLMTLQWDLFDLVVAGSPFCPFMNDGPARDSGSLARALEILAPRARKAVLALPVAPMEKDLPFVDLLLQGAAEAGLAGVEVQSHAMAYRVRQRYPRLGIFFGSFANVFTDACAREMESLGASGGCLPFEMEGSEQALLAKGTPMTIFLPILGSFPLSFSQVCFFHPEGAGEGCSRSCSGELAVDFGEGMTVLQKGRAIFSDKVLCLLGPLPGIVEAGFGAFRIEGLLMTGDGINRAGEIAGKALGSLAVGDSPCLEALLKEAASLSPRGFCNGFFFGQRGMDYVEEPYYGRERP
jgi:collagenase-like PrtC family protease